MNEEREIGYVYKETLENIASAIKEKLQSPSSMYPSEMDDRIRLIDTSGIHPTGTINITENGTYDVTEYASAEVNTPTVDDYFIGDIQYGTSETSGANRMIKKIPDNTIVTGTNLDRAFYQCVELTSIPLLDTSNVTTMNYTFYGCMALTTIPLLNTSNVTTMNYTFKNCTSLTQIPLINTSNVTEMEQMFYDTRRLNTIPLLNTSNVTKMNGMFYSSGITSLPQINTSNVTNFNTMFRQATNLTTVPTLDLTSATNTEQMFYACTALTTIPNFVNCGTGLTNTNLMFYQCNALTGGNINLNLTNVSSMSQMFYMCTNLTSVDFSNSTPRNGTLVVYNMFYQCTSLQFIDMRVFDFTQMQSYTNMFGQYAYNRIPANCLIVVADDTQKAFVNTNFTWLTNVKTVAEYEAS